VPGDIISVAIGDRIPADCRILSIQSNSFSVDQSILTGESESVSKDVRVVKDSNAVKQDQINMLFSGTTVVTGHAIALVVLTGANTAIGDIHDSITSQISQPTPLKEKLNDFGDQLAKVITGICILVWIINIGNFNDPSHGGFTKGAIYYLKVCVDLPCVNFTINMFRSLSPLAWLLFRKVSRLLSLHVLLWEPVRWLPGMLLSEVCLLSRHLEAAV